jgi:hypothetical protein
VESVEAVTPTESAPATESAATVDSTAASMASTAATTGERGRRCQNHGGQSDYQGPQCHVLLHLCNARSRRREAKPSTISADSYRFLMRLPKDGTFPLLCRFCSGERVGRESVCTCEGDEVAIATPPHRFTQMQLLTMTGYTDATRRGFFDGSDIDGRFLFVDPARFAYGQMSWSGTAPGGAIFDRLDRLMTRPVAQVPAPTAPPPVAMSVPDRYVQTPQGDSSVVVPGHWERRLSDHEVYTPPRPPANERQVP